MRVSECMTTQVRVAAPDNTLQSAAQIMADIDAGFLPVAAEDRLIGIVTDRDIAIRGVAAGKPPETGICEIMSEDVRYCHEDDEVEDVLETMGNMQVRRLPVLDAAERLVGIVSLSDLAGNGEAEGTGKALGEITRPSGFHSQHV